MVNNTVVIATNASLLADMLREKLRDADFRVFVAATDSDLAAKIKTAFPRLIFIEHCFHGEDTDVLIQRMVRHNRNIRIVVWAVSAVKPRAAVRFIHAGAESFIPLRDMGNDFDAILCRIATGRRYCPADVEALFNRDSEMPVIGKGLTKCEKKIFKLTIEEKSRQEIADNLGITIHTVQFHRGNIYRKCGCNTPLGMLVNGLKRGLIHQNDL